MTTVAQHTEKQRELDEDTRRAWAEYTEGLRELSGDEYDLVEDECWTELQDKLSQVEDRRRRLASETP